MAEKYVRCDSHCKYPAYDKEEVDNLLEKTDIELKGLTKEINVERERINNIINLEEGSTTGDAELIDIRIAEDGSIYSSAGSSVRNQIKNVKNDIDVKLETYNNRIHETKINIPSELWEIGGINNTTGVNADGNLWIRTKEFLTFDEITQIFKMKTTELTNWKFFVEYDMDGTFIKCQNFANIKGSLISKNKKYRIALKNNDEVVNDINDVLSKIEFSIVNYLDLKTNDIYDIEELNMIKSKFVIEDTYFGSDNLKFDYSGQYSIVLIPIEPSTQYYGSQVRFFNAFLDGNKDIIGSVHKSDNEPLTNPFTTPSNARYLLTTQSTSTIGKTAYISKVNQYYDEKAISIKPKTNVIGNVTHVLKDKTISLLGDSITSTDYENPYWGEIIKNRTDCKINNYGISGTTLAHTDDRHLWDYHFEKLDAETIGYDAEDSTTWGTGNCFCERYTKLDDNSDAVVVMGGTNDGDVPLGTWDSTDTSTFYGALNTLFSGLLNKFNGKPILVCTPIQKSDSYSTNVIDPLSELKEKTSSSTISLQLRAEAIKTKCKQYGIPCLDLFNESGINGGDSSKSYYRDNDTLHPSRYGQERIANLIQGEIEKFFK